MTEKFKSSDPILEQIIAARREELARLQKSRAEQSKQQERRNQAHLAAIKKALPQDFAAVMDTVTKIQDEQTAITRADVDKIKAAFDVATPGEKARKPPYVFNNRLLVPCRSPGWVSPCSAYYSEDDVLKWDGTNFSMMPPAIPSCFGSGSGWYSDNASKANARTEWWFCFNVPEDRSYTLTVTVPLWGEYIVIADDGWLTSAYAKTSVSIASGVVQSGIGYGDDAQQQVFDYEGDNINVNEIYDAHRALSFNKVLAAGSVYLYLDIDYDTYARAGGSYASLAFNNSLVPWLYVG